MNGRKWAFLPETAFSRGCCFEKTSPYLSGAPFGMQEACSFPLMRADATRSNLGVEPT